MAVGFVLSVFAVRVFVTSSVFQDTRAAHFTSVLSCSTSHDTRVASQVDLSRLIATSILLPTANLSVENTIHLVRAIHAVQVSIALSGASDTLSIHTSPLVRVTNLVSVSTTTTSRSARSSSVSSSKIGHSSALFFIRSVATVIDAVAPQCAFNTLSVITLELSLVTSTVSFVR